MGEIVALQWRRILDSRGNPTVECDVWTPSGFGTAAAPSGASTGAHEVTAFPKGSVSEGVRQARSRLLPALEGADVQAQQEIDARIEEADGTHDFDHIGGNVAIATSLACAKAAASEQGMELFRYMGGSLATQLPIPFGNVLGGGEHAIGGTDIQEFMAVPQTRDPKESVFAQARVHQEVSHILSDRLPNQALGKGDEGAWVAPIDNREALDVVQEACELISADTGHDIGIALDVAATELWNGQAYEYDEKNRSTDEQLEFLLDLVDEFPIISIEDPFHEEAFEAFAELTDRVDDDVLVIGDDLYTTNEDRLRRGIETTASNAILIKPNQIGTLTRTVRTVRLAHRSGLKTVISHRSGETPDTTIAHLAVALGCHGIKTGAVGGERIAKLNELVRIDERIGES